jgi:hypothetical protein
MSAIDAVHKLTERYAKAGKKLHLRYLSADCRQLLHAGTMLLILISLRTLLTKWCLIKKTDLMKFKSVFYIRFSVP